MDTLFHAIRNFCHDLGLHFFIADSEGIVVYPRSEKRHVIHIYNELMKPGQEAFAIKSNDFIVGYLFVTSVLSSLEKELLQKQLDDIQHRVFEQHNSRALNRDAFLQNLLTGYLTTEEIGEAADQFRFDKTHCYLQIFMKTIPPLQEAEMHLQDVARIIQHYAEQAVRTHTLLLRTGEAVLLLEFSKKDEALIERTKLQLSNASQNILAQLKKLPTYQRTSVILGVGSTAFYLEELHEGFLFLKDFVRTATKLNVRSHIIFYEHHPMYSLLHHISPKESKEFVSAVFKHIDMNDKKIIDSLRMLFRCNLNISQAATQLHVHRNTLEYRIHKIHQLSHLNPLHTNDAMQFSLAIQLRELYNL